MSVERHGPVQVGRPRSLEGVVEVPRPAKAIHRQKVSASMEWKKGNRKEAQKLWAEADQARKEFQAKKKKNQKQAGGAEPEKDTADGQSS